MKRSEYLKELCRAKKCPIREEKDDFEARSEIKLKGNISGPILHTAKFKAHIPWKAADRIDFSYWTSLHEIGHVYTFEEYILSPEDNFLNMMTGGVPRSLGENEAGAWRWALENAREIPSPKVWAQIRGALATYLDSMYTTPGPVFQKLYDEAGEKRGKERFDYHAKKFWGPKIPQDPPPTPEV